MRPRAPRPSAGRGRGPRVALWLAAGLPQCRGRWLRRAPSPSENPKPHIGRADLCTGTLYDALPCPSHEGVPILPVGDHHIACFVSKGLDGQTHVGANARSVDHRAVFWFSASAGFEQRLSNFNNVQYVGDIEVGGQQVGALFDTGSDDLVLRSAECHGCTHHAPPYDHHRSEHYKLHGVIHKITYGAGSCSVVRGWDSVSVGPLHAPEQEIWEVMHHSIPLWEHAAYSALVGMSPTAGSGYVRGSTLLASLGVDAFSVCLGRANGSDGYLTWGALRAPGHPAARLLVHDQWVARLGNITLAGAPSVRLCGSSPCSVLLDTGHSLIEGPQAQILELSKHISINQDCSNLHELPTLRFEVDGQPLELPPLAYVVRVGGTPADARRVWPFLPTGGTLKAFRPHSCQPAFMMGRGGSSELGPQWVIGMPFFRQYRTTFDRAEHAMSFEAMGPADCQRGGAAAPAGVSLAARGGRAEAAALAPVEVDLRDVVALAARRHAAPLALVAG